MLELRVRALCRCPEVARSARPRVGVARIPNGGIHVAMVSSIIFTIPIANRDPIAADRVYRRNIPDQSF
jgi:hypothetical protein